jgi:hypothetical protein
VACAGFFFFFFWRSFSLVLVVFLLDICGSLSLVVAGGSCDSARLFFCLKMLAIMEDFPF